MPVALGLVAIVSAIISATLFAYFGWLTGLLVALGTSSAIPVFIVLFKFLLFYSAQKKGPLLPYKETNIRS